MTEPEPSHAIEDLITILQPVGADEQATAFAERVVADTDPDDVLSVSELLVTMHEAGMEQLVRDVLRSAPCRTHRSHQDICRGEPAYSLLTPCVPSARRLR